MVCLAKDGEEIRHIVGDQSPNKNELPKVSNAVCIYGQVVGPHPVKLSPSPTMAALLLLLTLQIVTSRKFLSNLIEVPICECLGLAGKRKRVCQETAEVKTMSAQIR